MDTHTEEGPRTEDLQVLASRGLEIKRFLESSAVAAALVMTRARIYDEMCDGVTKGIREEAFFERKALNRLFDSFRQIQQDGVIAQEAIRLREEEDDEHASEAIV